MRMQRSQVSDPWFATKFILATLCLQLILPDKAVLKMKWNKPSEFHAGQTGSQHNNNKKLRSLLILCNGKVCDLVHFCVV